MTEYWRLHYAPMRKGKERNRSDFGDLSNASVGDCFAVVRTEEREGNDAGHGHPQDAFNYFVDDRINGTMIMGYHYFRTDLVEFETLLAFESVPEAKIVVRDTGRVGPNGEPMKHPMLVLENEG